MHMGIDHPGHDNLSLCIYEFRFRVALLDAGGIAYFTDVAVFNHHGAVFYYLAFSV